ncbi:MAG: hypothetical protein IT304_11580 [Dehalococcoidia bacterium]|nr:hypothetical protein [Dehalococcoidia bacterium]
MTFARPVLMVFHGGLGDGAAERTMAAARVAAARRTVEAALAAGFEAAIVATDDVGAFDALPANVLLDVDRPGHPFAFGERLRGLVARYGLQRPAVMGSGAVPLLGEPELRLIVEQLDARDGRFVTNNFFSADLTAWTPGDAIFGVGELERDNVLPRRLRDEAGLAPVVLPRTTATQFDLDTPADLAVLSLGEVFAGGTSAAAAALPLAPYRGLLPLLCEKTAEVVVAGRVGSMTWAHLERDTACRVRVISEERGLATAPPGHRPRSVLGFLLEEVGPERFFRRLAEMGDAVVLDTRVIEAHLGLRPLREDRFQSDLLQPARVAEPTLRRLTEAALDVPMPVLLGGHSLVSGGLMALTDLAWRENDRRLGLSPQS